MNLSLFPSFTVLLLLTVFFRLTIQEDQCNLCTTPEIMSNTDETTCGRVPNNTESRMIMIRSWDRVSNACYIQVVGCPAYDLVLDSQCSSLYHNLEGMQCVGGKFTDPLTRLPIDKIRCNPSAPPPDPIDPCASCVLPTILSPIDTTSPCGEPLTNTTAIPQLDLQSDGTTCTLVSSGCGLYEVVMDGIGCAIGATPYAVCEDGVFKADGRIVEKIRCVTSQIPQPPANTCDNCNLPSILPQQDDTTNCGFGTGPDTNLTVVWNETTQMCELSFTGCANGYETLYDNSCYAFDISNTPACDPSVGGGYTNAGVSWPLEAVRCLY